LFKGSDKCPPGTIKRRFLRKMRLKQKLETFFKLRPGVEELVKKKLAARKKAKQTVNLRELEKMLDQTFGYEYMGTDNDDCDENEIDVINQIISKEYLVKYEDICFGKKIGEGAYAEVFEANYKGEPVAIKAVKKGSCRQHQLRIFAREVSCLRRVVGVDKMVQMKGACVQPTCCILLEYFPCGSVEDLVKNHRKLNFDEALKVAKDIADGMKTLHAMRPAIMHRDITCQNILVRLDSSGNIDSAVLTDFGIARWKDQKGAQTLSPLGHPRYRAPEVSSKRPYTKKVDVYCFGSCLYELFSGCKVMEGLSDMEVCRMRILGKLPTIPESVPDLMSKLIARCWEANPKHRPSFKEIAKVLEKKLKSSQRGKRISNLCN